MNLPWESIALVLTILIWLLLLVTRSPKAVEPEPTPEPAPLPEPEPLVFGDRFFAEFDRGQPPTHQPWAIYSLMRVVNRDGKPLFWVDTRQNALDLIAALELALDAEEDFELWGSEQFGKQDEAETQAPEA